MHIICATPSAAAQVLDILYTVLLLPLRDFTIQPVFSTTPPLLFVTVPALAPAQVIRIRAIPDTEMRE